MQAPWQKLGFQLKLGLRPRQESCWLPRENLFGDNTERDKQIRQKQHLFAYNHAAIFAAYPSASIASAKRIFLEKADFPARHLNMRTPLRV